MNLKEFGVVFMVMCEYFGAKPSEGLSQVYFEDLKDLTIEEFKQGFQVLRDSRIFNGLPKIAEIRDSIYGKIEDRVSLAWESFLRNLGDPYVSIIFEDGAIGHAIEAMGGWEEVNRWTIEECRFRRKEFEAIYLANLRRGNIEPIKLIGLIEGNNSQKEEWKKFTPETKVVESQNRIMVGNKKQPERIDLKMRSAGDEMEAPF